MYKFVVTAVASLFLTAAAAQAAKVKELPNGEYTAMFESACLTFTVADTKVTRFVLAASCSPADMANPKVVLEKAPDLRVKGDTITFGDASFKISDHDPNTGVVKGKWKRGKSNFDAAFVMKR